MIVDGANITPEMIAYLKDFQCGDNDWMLNAIDTVNEYFLSHRGDGDYEPKEILDLMANMSTIKFYLKAFMEGGQNEENRF